MLKSYLDIGFIQRSSSGSVDGNTYIDIGAIQHELSSSSMLPGAVTLVYSGPSGISLNETIAPSGGTGTIARQWQRSTNNGSYSDLTGVTSTTCDDTDVSENTAYRYKIHYTDDGDGDTYSNVVHVEVYTGGLIGDGTAGFSRSRMVGGV